MKKGLLNPEAEFLSLSEIGQLFSPPVSRVSLWRWMKRGQLKLTAYKLGSIQFYKRSEVMVAIASLRLEKDIPDSETHFNTNKSTDYERETAF